MSFKEIQEFTPLESHILKALGLVLALPIAPTGDGSPAARVTCASGAALESISIASTQRPQSQGVGDIGLNPSFADPWVDIAGRGSIPNKFPYEPSPNVDFSLFEPLSISVYDPKIAVPYAENFSLTVERQLGSSTILSLGYVGSVGRHEVIAYEL